MTTPRQYLGIATVFITYAMVLAIPYGLFYHDWIAILIGVYALTVILLINYLNAETPY